MNSVMWFLSLSISLALSPGVVLAGERSGNLAQPGAAHEFTLQQVLSAPFPTNLIAASKKERFAWVFNAEGKRNLWIAEPLSDRKGYGSRQLTNYLEDDGQDIGDLQFAPNAESIVYVRGGDLEYPEQPYPNPALIPQGVEQDIWI